MRVNADTMLSKNNWEKPKREQKENNMIKQDFLVEPIKLNKAKWIVIYFSDFGDFGVDKANTIKQLNELVRFHQDNSNLFEVYELGE